ncbi:hypothetical protein [Microbacterium sp. LWH12-1.2]|uniref:hypothetical protein n=1 Tax=Microbacterium sp. LWH12-1.2 TaxID=3135259 RepID=UPI003427C145
MLSADELVELRALQARAYGRDGGLSDADAERMRQLELQRMPASSAGQGVSSRSARSTVGEATLIDRASSSVVERGAQRRDETPAPASTADQRVSTRFARSTTGEGADGSTTGEGADGSTTEVAPEPSRSMLRLFWRPLAAISAALLLLGLAAGWAIFGQRSDAIALTDDQVQRRLELYDKGNYDEGSVRAIARDEEALVWFATRNDGDFACIVLDVGELSTLDCRPVADAAAHGMNLFLTLEESDPDPESGSYESTGIGATLLYSADDEPMVAIQRWTNSGNWLEQFDESQHPRVEELIAEGYEVSMLNQAGTFEGRPVWLAHRAENDERCLIVDRESSSAESCLPSAQALEGGLSLMIADVDVARGISKSWTFDVLFTKWQTPYLTITADAGELFTVKPGDRVEVGGEHGDPIEVGTDVPQG